MSRRPAFCPPKPAVARRHLIAPSTSARLEATFKTLANTTRIRLLHALIRAKSAIRPWP